ncbi:MAG TPA: DegT/DnrJ/EryC1/StrS family aminotransferase [Vicinamibacterales bacterium]
MTTKVPLLDLRAQFEPIRDEVLREIVRVCDEQQFVLGPNVERLERALAERIGVAHAIGVSSGTDAILASLMALGIGSGDEVITPTYSFFATAGCVWRSGARPVFVDVDPRTLNVTAEHIAHAITPRTRAIIPVHLYGQPVDMEPIMELARSRGISVIEDACQSIDALDGGRPVGSIGHCGCFSFFPSKNLGGFGDGGLVTTNDAALAERIRLIRGHGARRKYHHQIVGGNFRLDGLQAVVLSAKLPHLDRWTAGRQRNAARYRELFTSLAAERSIPIVEPGPAPTQPGTLALPFERPGVRHVYNQFVIRTGRRDAVKAQLEAAQIGCEIYYPVPFHLQECFASLGYKAGDLPVAEAAAKDSLALPIYPELTEAQQRYVVEQVLAAVQPAAVQAP